MAVAGDKAELNRLMKKIHKLKLYHRASRFADVEDMIKNSCSVWKIGHRLQSRNKFDSKSIHGAMNLRV